MSDYWKLVSFVLMMMWLGLALSINNDIKALQRRPLFQMTASDLKPQYWDAYLASCTAEVASMKPLVLQTPNFIASISNLEQRIASLEAKLNKYFIIENQPPIDPGICPATYPNHLSISTSTILFNDCKGNSR